MNQLSMVNKILRRLREDEVASVADNAYSQLIAELINEGLEEVQAAFMWSSLDTTVEFDTILDTRDYDLTAETTDRTILRMANKQAQVYVTDNGDTQSMVLVSPGDIDKLYFEDSFEPSIPIFFSVRKNITHDGVLMTVHPVPDRVVTITSVFWTPQEPMEIDGSDDATDFVVPWEPVFAYAYMMALNERGEEMGEAGHLAERRYLAALGAAIEQEISYLGMGDVYEFRRD